MARLTAAHLLILEALNQTPWDWFMGSSIERACFQKTGWSYPKTKWLEKHGLVEKVDGSVRISLAGRSALEGKP